MVHAVEQWDDAIAQFLRSDSAKCRLERRRLDGDPDDIKLSSIEPIGDPHRCLEGPERLALDGQPLGIVVSAAGPNEQGYRLAGLRERAAHESADPTRSENRMSHRPPPSILCAPFWPHSIQSPRGPEGCDAQNRK